MAEAMTRNAVKSHKITRYADIRDKIRSGWLFFASGDYLVSNVIQDMTRSPWSHVGIILRVEKLDRVLLLESVEDMGVRFAPLSKYLDDYEDGKRYRGAITLASVAGITADAVQELAKFGIDELTRPYDRGEVAAIVARIALGIGKAKRDREYICSELVYECYRRAGKVFEYNKKGFISPQDIWADDGVSFEFRIQ